MKKLLYAVLLFLLYTAVPSEALEKAAPMDFIFKGGDYRERITMIIEAPLTARIEREGGGLFYIDISGRSELKHTETDENGIETYSATPGSFSVRSDLGSYGSEPEGFSAGLIYEPATSSLGWILTVTGPEGPKETITRELTDNEYPFIGFQTTITADVGTNAILLQYAGILPETGEILLEVTDADAPEPLTRMKLSPSGIPGYFQIPGGGILLIEKIEDEEGIPCILYQWAKTPPL